MFDLELELAPKNLKKRQLSKIYHGDKFLRTLIPVPSSDIAHCGLCQQG